MKVVVTRASNDNYSQVMEFNTLEDLYDFSKDVRCRLIVRINRGNHFDSKEENECKLEIKIYDGYVE